MLYFEHVTPQQVSMATQCVHPRMGSLRYTREELVT